MRTFEYVKHATKKEVDDYFNGLKLDRERAYKKARVALNNNKEAVINEYNLMRNEYLENEEDYQRKQTAFYQKVCFLKRDKKCECGSDLRFIEGGVFGDFWGCTNHSDHTVLHRNYMKEERPNSYIPEPSLHRWVSDLRRRLNLRKGYATSHLYHFILENGLPDLSLFYHGVPASKSIYTIVDTRRKANSFELEQFEILKGKLDKCVWQFSVKYKDMGVQNSVQAHMDIVGSDSENVYIYECKTNEKDKDEFQKQLYIDLVTKMLKDSGSTKNVVFQYIIENN